MNTRSQQTIPPVYPEGSYELYALNRDDEIWEYLFSNTKEQVKSNLMEIPSELWHKYQVRTPYGETVNAEQWMFSEFINIDNKWEVGDAVQA